MIDADWMTKFAKKILRDAERKYLPRDNSYQFFGCRLAPKGPNIRFHDEFTGFWIELSSSASNNKDRLHYQIAHEAIHCLAPVRNPPAKMIEEGLAVWFSLDNPTFSGNYRELAVEELRTLPINANYLEARNCFLELTAVDPNAIRVLRKKQPNFFDMTPAFIKKMIPSVTDDLAERLCEEREMRPDGP